MVCIVVVKFVFIACYHGIVGSNGCTDGDGGSGERVDDDEDGDEGHVSDCGGDGVSGNGDVITEAVIVVLVVVVAVIYGFGLLTREWFII